MKPEIENFKEYSPKEVLPQEQSVQLAQDVVVGAVRV